MARLEQERDEARAQFERARGELALAVAGIERQKRIIEGLRRRLFGPSTVRLDPAQLQLLFEELVLGKPAPPAEPGDEGSPAPEEAKPDAAGSRRTKAERFPKNLRVVVDEVIVPAEVTADPDSYIEIGEEHHDELDVTRAQMFWRRKVRKKFVRKDDRSRPPVIAPAPLPSIPGTRCAPGLAARIGVDKYEDHLPHYRQAQRFRRRLGVDLGRQTINAWTHATAGHLRPIGLAIRREVLASDELQIDETPLEYLNPGHGSTSRGFLWAYRAPRGKGSFMDWRLGRGHEALLNVLGYDEQSGTIAYQGTIQCDGFSAYEALVKRYAGIRLAGCRTTRPSSKPPN